MAQEVNVKVNVQTQEAERQLAQFREKVATAGERARGARGGGLSVGGRSRLNRARGLTGTGGGNAARTAASLKGIARSVGLVLAAITIVIELTKQVFTIVEAIGLAFDSFGFTNIGEKLQELSGFLNDNFGKILSQLDRTRAITEVGKKFAASGLALPAQDLVTVSNRFAEAGARSFREEQRKSARSKQDYARIIYGALGG